jgi:hypothetical protein
VALPILLFDATNQEIVVIRVFINRFDLLKELPLPG